MIYHTVTTSQQARNASIQQDVPAHHPRIIQGGMGMGVSNWRLANAVSRLGQLGVVSGTAIDTIFARRLQDGDPGGHLRRALSHFPVPEMAERALDNFFIPGGKDPEKPYKVIGLFSLHPPESNLELCVLANFCEVFLAKEGHNGLVGINLLEKILLPNLPSLYGAIMAGVDYVLMGAGIPREIPGALDCLAKHQKARLRLTVEGALPGEDYFFEFIPNKLIPKQLPALKRPLFLAIIASTVLGIALARRTQSPINGFVIEGPLAGGHNAPPRGELQLNARGEPIYGLRDEVDLEKIRGLGLPFWLAGSYASPEKLHQALERGASGIQVGTAFAFCAESGMMESVKRAVLQKVREGAIDVFTDPRISPTGFPFKVVRLEGSISEKACYQERTRICDLGYLRLAYKRPDGTLGYRCPAEPAEVYVQKGGRAEETVDRKCLCNGLQAVIGLPQRQKDGYLEKPLVTAGDDLQNIARFLKPGKDSYSAKEVVDYLLA